jgi:hypothetical protein
MRRLVLGGLALVLLAACGPVATQQAYYGQLQTWVGQPADLLARTWGPPDKSFKLSDGSTLLQYERLKQRYVRGASYPDTDYVTVRGKDGRYYNRPVTRWREGPGYFNIDRCSTRFEVGADGVIRTFQFEGDDCVAYPPPETKAG